MSENWHVEKRAGRGIVGDMNFWHGKKVFIPGGGGFIGSHLVEQLLSLGAKVIVPKRPDRPAYPNIAHILDHIRLLPLDLGNESGVAKALDGMDVVLYLATYTGGVLFSSTRHAVMAYENLRPFMSTLEGARKAGVRRFLVVSSACVYSDDAPSPTPEEAGFEGMPQRSNEGYGMAKRMQEYLGMRYTAERALPCPIVRLFNVYGPRGHFDPESAMVIPSLIRRITGAGKELEVWGSGKAVRPFLFVDDCVTGIIAAAEHGPAGEPINLAAQEGTSIRELTELALQLMDRSDLAIRFDTTKPEGQLKRLADIRRAKNLLGFKPSIPLKEGLERTIRWFLNEKAAGRLE